MFWLLTPDSRQHSGILCPLPTSPFCWTIAAQSSRLSSLLSLCPVSRSYSFLLICLLFMSSILTLRSFFRSFSSSLWGISFTSGSWASLRCWTASSLTLGLSCCFTQGTKCAIYPRSSCGSSYRFKLSIFDWPRWDGFWLWQWHDDKPVPHVRDVNHEWHITDRWACYN